MRSAIGIINAARVGSGFVGPLVATSVLATGSPGLLYATFGAAGIATVLLLRRRVGSRGALRRRGGPARPPP